MDYTQDPSGFGAIIEPATVPPLFFSVRQRTLRSEGRALLMKLGRMLRDQPALRVRVEGHADAREAPVHHPAPARYLQQLSAQRTATVASYLRDLGVSAARVMEVAYGTSQPAASSDDSENRQLNRRVELELEGLRP
ncbi:OmpA family protein [Hymenobacter yonginensis]|uniref:OmpA family protein n=1 Tax=Hymenobacter yonginensis TaxID=748197 RepID=UPI0038CC142E